MNQMFCNAFWFHSSGSLRFPGSVFAGLLRKVSYFRSLGFWWSDTIFCNDHQTEVSVWHIGTYHWPCTVPVVNLCRHSPHMTQVARLRWSFQMESEQISDSTLSGPLAWGKTLQIKDMKLDRVVSIAEYKLPLVQSEIPALSDPYPAKVRTLLDLFHHIYILWWVCWWINPKLIHWQLRKWVCLQRRFALHLNSKMQRVAIECIGNVLTVFNA